MAGSAATFRSHAAFVHPKSVSWGRPYSSAEKRWSTKCDIAIHRYTIMQASSRKAVEEKTSSSSSSLRLYEYKGRKISYRHKPASPGYEAASPLLLVHPVGIGLSSWFWSKFFEVWKGAELYAPDLIGCGLENGGDAWDPNDQGSVLPLTWVKVLEAMVQNKILLPDAQPEEKRRGLMKRFRKSKDTATEALKPKSCVVVAQGGLAPIGVMLASRNPEEIISKLVLTSPPIWNVMTTAFPEYETESNYDFFRSPLGNLLFNVLQQPWAVRFFSDQFLFEDKCDDLWVKLASSKEATTSEARLPVIVSNSGFLNLRSYEDDLVNLEQPTLVVSGADDAARAEQRLPYGKRMKFCTLTSTEGKNVLPWESPEEVCDAIEAFLSYSTYEE